MRLQKKRIDFQHGGSLENKYEVYIDTHKDNGFDELLGKWPEKKCRYCQMVFPSFPDRGKVQWSLGCR